MRYGVTACLKSWAAVALAVLIVGVGMLFKGSALSKIDGERTYYLHSASSWASCKSELDLLDLPFVKGESVSVTVADGVNFAQGIIQTYEAEVLFVEETADAVSYYCFSPNISNCISLNGRAVNLHIAVAVQRESVVVGTPIIFGGF